LINWHRRYHGPPLCQSSQQFLVALSIFLYGNAASFERKRFPIRIEGRKHFSPCARLRGYQRDWHIEFAQHCGYLAEETVAALDGTYDVILSQLVRMVQTADKWAPD